jgi:hypothetical protein
MINQKKLTLINKVLELEQWYNSYLTEDADQPLLYAIKRNLNSIKVIVKRF